VEIVARLGGDPDLARRRGSGGRSFLLLATAVEAEEQEQAEALD
jgi:hypothetical protein